MKACRLFEEDEFLDDDDEDDRRHRNDPITIEMNFSVSTLESGRLSLDMRGRAYPYVSSGGFFGLGMPLRPGHDIDKEIARQIEHEKRWFRAMYPGRPLKLKITRPGPKQITFGDVRQ